jgi:hypothetical protein
MPESLLPLTTKDINAYAKHKYGNAFAGTYEITNGQASDELIESIENEEDGKSIYLLLLIKDGKNVGHWVGLFANGNDAYYFDPMGMMSLPLEVVNLFDNFKYNQKVLQKLSDERCGLYTLREAERFLKKR